MHARMKSLALRFLAIGVACAGVSAVAGQRVDAYTTRVDEEQDKTLKLDNGAVVEIRGMRSSRGGVRIGPDCVLFREGLRWKLWIEDDDTYDCEVVKQPGGIAERAESLRLLEVKYDGAVLLMEDGSIYEVEQRDVSDTRRWRGPSDALVIRDKELLNLDERGGLMRVRKLR